MEWYSLRVISGKEMNAQEDIMREISDGGVADQVTEVFVPYEKVVAMRNNKKIDTITENTPTITVDPNNSSFESHETFFNSIWILPKY